MNKNIITLFNCRMAVLKITPDFRVALFKDPSQWLPYSQVQLISVLVEKYPEDQTIGIYGVRINYHHRDDIWKDQSLLAKICPKNVAQKTKQRFFNRFRKTPKPPIVKKSLIYKKGMDPWFMDQTLVDFRLITRESFFTLFDGISST